MALSHQRWIFGQVVLAKDLDVLLRLPRGPALFDVVVVVEQILAEILGVEGLDIGIVNA